MELEPIRKRPKNLQAKNLKDLIRVYDDVIPESMCQEIIDIYERNVDYHQRFENNGLPTFTQLNITAVHETSEELSDLNEALVATSVKYLRRYIKDLNITFEFPEQYAFEQVRLKKYSADLQDEFKEHVDVGDHASAKRFLVFFLYLNEVKQGGETEFPYLNYRVKPKAGRMLVFPPLWLFPHCGRIPVSNDKYIVGSYLHYI